MQGFEAPETVTETFSGLETEPVETSEGGTCRATRRILIVSPMPASLHPLVAELTARCFDVMVFHRADDPMLGLVQADLMILDRTKKDAAGTNGELPARHGKVPVVFLIGGDAGEEASDGFGSHAVSWPSPAEEILSRIERLAGRGSRAVPEGGEQSALKDIVVDMNRMTVYRSGTPVDLTRTEFELLKVLLNANGRVLPRQEIMDLVWGEQYFGGSNTVDVHIKSLRQKLGDDPRKPKYIATIRGVGYRIAD